MGSTVASGGDNAPRSHLPVHGRRVGEGTQREDGAMEQAELTDRFEAERPRLRAVALRMLGSTAEADDAVQEAWLRLDRSDADGIDNLAAWLTTVVSRICLDLLRSRIARREDPLGARPEA